MNNFEPTVFIVDDDADACASVAALVQSMGVGCESFHSAEGFLNSYQDDRPGCLVTDVRMLGMSGIELQEELMRRNLVLPVIVLTAYARTQLAVRAVKNGAVTMLDKPYNDDELWDAIRNALTLDEVRREEQFKNQQIKERLAGLSDSERQVMDMVIKGVPNKAIASRLEVSVRTVENRRHEVFQKMKANSVAELVALAISVGELDAPPVESSPSS